MPRTSLLRPVSQELLIDIRDAARPLRSPADLDPLLERIGPARYVLLGEASHGTHEYYAWRQRLSQRLIEEYGFSFIAVEGDWPDCYRVNRYVKGLDRQSPSAWSVLHAFDRWPTWMWANEEVVQLAEWLRQHNDPLPEERRVGFYGLDVYSLRESMHRVLEYLQQHDSSGVQTARRAFECFDRYGPDVEDYARATRWVSPTCEDAVVALLRETQRRRFITAGGGREAQFNAEQNAIVARNAERYYRSMMAGRAESWNIRDRHMVETLERLMRYHGAAAKGIVWAHNTHVGDARFTDMQQQGEVNVGQLVRQEHGADEAAIVGFSSHRGTVIAGDAWEAPMETMNVPPGASGSWEDVLHQACERDALLLLDRVRPRSPMHERRGHRAIGVVYHPEYEHFGNYVPTVLTRRYDALLWLEETRALRPLHLEAPTSGEAPETYPSGV